MKTEKTNKLINTYELNKAADLVEAFNSAAELVAQVMFDINNEITKTMHASNKAEAPAEQTRLDNRYYELRDIRFKINNSATNFTNKK